MGILGLRRKNLQGETPIFMSVDEILKDGERNGFINDGRVDIEGLIRNMGLRIEKKALDSSISGCLKKIDGQWTIIVNEKHNEKRQRFTMAHELAHYYLHRTFKDSFTDDEIFYRNEESHSIEYAANRFASDLLINPSALKKVIKQGTVFIDEIANHFQVSSIAVKIQLSNMGYRIK